MTLNKKGLKAASSNKKLKELLVNRFKNMNTQDTNVNDSIKLRGYTWLLDSGHGGMIDGVYQTSPKNWKRAYFLNGILLDPRKYSLEQLEKMCDTKYYEGVGNRDIVRRIMDLCKAHNIKYIDIVNSEKDIPLKSRVATANSIYKTDKKCIYVSVHSNAFDKQGPNGYSIFTSKGTTASDRIATIFYHKFEALFPNITMRKDLSDGDVDWEANFTVLTDTKMPAVLSENLFYTNYDDVLILLSEEGRQKIAQAHFDAMLHIEHNGY